MKINQFFNYSASELQIAWERWIKNCKKNTTQNFQMHQINKGNCKMALFLLQIPNSMPSRSADWSQNWPPFFFLLLSSNVWRKPIITVFGNLPWKFRRLISTRSPLSNKLCYLYTSRFSYQLCQTLGDDNRNQIQ